MARRSTYPQLEASRDNVVAARVYGDGAGPLQEVPVADVLSRDGWTLLKKAANQANESETMVSDSTLTFAIAAGAKVAIRGEIYATTGATNDVTFQIIGPADPTLVLITFTNVVPTPLVTQTTAFGADVVIPAAATPTTLRFEGIIHNGLNAGDVTVQYLCEDDTDPQTVYALSRLEHTYAG